MRTIFILGALLCVSSTAGAQSIPDSTARKQQRLLDSLATALAALPVRFDSAASAPPPARASGSE